MGYLMTFNDLPQTVIYGPFVLSNNCLAVLFSHDRKMHIQPVIQVILRSRLLTTLTHRCGFVYEYSFTVTKYRTRGWGQAL